MIIASASAPAWPYPETRTDEVTETLHGLPISDPYRWLEDDRSVETQAWVQAQNRVTLGYLEQLPRREPIRARLRALWNYERFGLPFHRGGRWFFTYNSGLRNQAALLTTASLEAEPTVLLDPNVLSPDGTTSLGHIAPNETGTLLAYGLSEAGSDWNTIRVREIATGRDLVDSVNWVKFSSLSWKKDASGFFYSRYATPAPGAALTAKNQFHQLYFHRLGTPQRDDLLIYERRDQPEWGFEGQVTEDGSYLIINVWQGTEPVNRIFFQDLTAGGPVEELLNANDARYHFIDNEGPVFYFHTDLQAPCYRVIAVDTREPARDRWREIIPEIPQVLLENVSTAGGQMFAEYLRDANSQVKSFDFEGQLLCEIALPGIGSVGGFGGHRDDAATFFSFSSFTEPGAIYRLDLQTGKSQLWRQPKVDFDTTRYETTQVFYPSKDGTRIPMFLVHRKGLILDGSHPVILYGYGGFNINMTPGFAVSRAVWLEMGGVFALPNLRGGGEYGREWHQAGVKLRKQTVFDDFIAAAEWLISQGYTTSPRLAIQGGSNGGLLVGACLTQRPELYGAAVPAVGVLDMLRFEQFTIGWGWRSDYGSVDVEEEFQALLRYSPYHNLKKETRYPATLVLTSDHDDRVVPAHSFKFAARLQNCQAADGPPTLIRIEISAGHGAGTALSKTIDKSADELTFIAEALGMAP